MKHLFANIGLALLLSIPPAALAQGGTLYQRIHDFTEFERATKGTELPTKRFIPMIYIESTKELKAKDIDPALLDNYQTLCGGKFGYDECLKVVAGIKLYTAKTQFIRALGRDLQLIASGYEVPIDDHPRSMMSIGIKLPGIIKIWQADTDPLTTPAKSVKLRSGIWPEEPDDIDFKPLAKALEALVDEEDGKKDYDKLIAAVWRYHYGVWYIDAIEKGDCEANTGEGTDMHNLFARWCDVELELMIILEEIPQFPEDYDPPLRPGEIVFFPTRSIGDILVWVRVDAKEDSVVGGGDIGLAWELPLEPVFPTLIDPNDEVVLGGLYPNPPRVPEPRTGLCAQPVSKKGYLCRQMTSVDCPAEEKKKPQQGGGGKSMTNSGITLTTCKPQNLTGGILTFITESGPNVCGIGGWRSPLPPKKDAVKDTDKRDADIRPGECSNCAVDFYTEEECGPDDDPKVPKRDDAAYTHAKDKNGVIKVCFPKSGLPGESYLAVHELVHVQQLCNLPENGHEIIFGTVQKCCASEYQAYMVQCNVLEEDGILQAAGYSVQYCASTWSNVSCKSFSKKGESVCSKAKPDEVKEMVKKIEEAIKDIDTTANSDARVQAMKASLPQVCTPKCRAKYANTIGNNACYLGQCIEQSIEYHRIIPGRITYVTQGQSFPWDADAKPKSDIGDFLSIPPLTTRAFPIYRPAQFMNELDLTLCQTNGLPLLHPPQRCSFDPRRQLDLPQSSFLFMAKGLLNQPGEQAAATRTAQEMLPSIGTRMGTLLYKQYLHGAMRSFKSLIDVSTVLLKEIADTKFPVEMCKRYDG